MGISDILPAMPGMKTKLISRSKKEMENFIGPKLRIITPETASQKVPRTVPSVRSQNTVIKVFSDRGLYIKYY